MNDRFQPPTIMAEKGELYTLVPVEERQEDAHTEENKRSRQADAESDPDEVFDKDFWLKVRRSNNSYLKPVEALSRFMSDL